MASLRTQVSAAIVVAIVGACGLYLFLTWLLGLPLRPVPSQVEQQKQLADVVKVALGLAAGAGAAVALIVGYRRARVEEAASHRDDQRLFSTRYQDAADLLGHDKPAVRLAGVYALARLADDWHEQRQACVDVLCAYLRLPYNADSNPGERAIRLSIINLITAHLRLDATVSWNGCHFDLSGAWFDGGDFTSLHLTGGSLDFTGATFAAGSMHSEGASSRRHK
jgi:hypothetical protein